MAKKGRPDLPPLFGPQPEPTVQEAFSIIVDECLEREITQANQDKSDINCFPTIFTFDHKAEVAQRLSSLHHLYARDHRTNFMVFQEEGVTIEQATIMARKSGRFSS